MKEYGNVEIANLKVTFYQKKNASSVKFPNPMILNIIYHENNGNVKIANLILISPRRQSVLNVNFLSQKMLFTL